MFIQQTISEDELFDFNFESQRKPVVSLEAFFIGTENEGSIARNLEDRPGFEFFYDLLKDIYNREDVNNVLVKITDIEILEIGNKYMFPFSERVYIIASANREAVSEWGKPLMPDKISEGGVLDLHPEFASEVLEGNKVYALTWN